MKRLVKLINEESGSALLMVLVFTVIFMILLAILVSDLLFNWKLYSYVKGKFLSQMMVSDIVSILRFEETRELTDGDDVFSYIYNVWEAPSMAHVFKYSFDNNDPYNFLKYYPFPDFSTLASINVDVKEILYPVGAFYLDSVSTATEDVHNQHNIRIVAVTAYPGADLDEIYNDMLSEYNTAGIVDAEKFYHTLSDVSFNMYWKNTETIVMASGNAKEWGEQLRVKGDVWEKPAAGNVVNFRPVRSMLNTWEVYSSGSNKIAEALYRHEDSSDPSTNGNHLVDSVIAYGKYHYGGDYFSVDGILFGNGPMDSSKITISPSGGAYVYTNNGYKYIDFYSGGYFRRMAVISLTRKVLKDQDNGYTDGEGDPWNDNNSVYNTFVSSGMPWYRFVSAANWSIGWISGEIIPSSIDYILWEYHYLNSGQMSPTDLSSGNVTLKKFYTDILLQNGFATSDNRMFEAFFTDHSWDELIRDDALSPIKRAQKNGDYVGVSGGNSYVVTLYTKNMSGQLHTILRYAEGACEYKKGCRLTGQTHDIDLQTRSSTGKGVLVDFGDDAQIFLVTPCQPSYKIIPGSPPVELYTPYPVWPDLCHIAYNRNDLPGDSFLVSNVKFFGSDLWGYRYNFSSSDISGGEIMNINGKHIAIIDMYSLPNKSRLEVWHYVDGRWIVKPYNTVESTLPTDVKMWILQNARDLALSQYMSNNPDKFMLYPDDAINPLAADTRYNPNWQYEWTRFVPTTENSFRYFFSGYSKNGVQPKIYHPNWKNMIQYNFKITLVGERLALLGDVIPVPGDIKENKTPVYEVDLAGPYPEENDDIPNLSKIPYGERLGFLLKGCNDASYIGTSAYPSDGVSTCSGYSFWVWDKIGYINYNNDSSTSGEFDFVSKGNKYGFRFAKSNSLYIGRDNTNREMDDDDTDPFNPYHWELYSWDKLIYADAYVKNGGVGFVYLNNYGDRTRIADNEDSIWDNDADSNPYKYPINSETFRLLGSMMMWGGRDVYLPVEYSYGIYTHTPDDPGWGITSPIYFLPDNAFSNKNTYWLMSDDERFVNVHIGDIRMKR